MVTHVVTLSKVCDRRLSNAELFYKADENELHSERKIVRQILIKMQQIVETYLHYTTSNSGNSTAKTENKKLNL